jgi:primary-amine oxidase
MLSRRPSSLYRAVGLLVLLLVSAAALSGTSGRVTDQAERPASSTQATDPGDPQATNAATATMAAVVTHPLDPLTADEYHATLQVLRAANKIDDATRFPLISLHEPDKRRVLAWKPGEPIQRAAFVMVKQGAQTFEAVVDLTGRKLESWREMPGVQPSLLFEEGVGVQEIALRDPAFLAALAARGISDTSQLLCVPLTIGYFNIPEEAGQRLMKVPCYSTEDSATNLFARPIEGLFALVDLNARKVLKVVDTGTRPLPQRSYEFSEDAVGKLRDPMKPVQIAQPQGSNIVVNGHAITWDTWSFHQRLDKRSGLVISQVTYRDQATPRSILYQGSLSEVFVPYMDPDLGWYWRSFMDAGEYGFGLFATPLTAGIDCPDTATFLNAVLSDDAGKPVAMERVICVFERPTGDPAWRHYETFNGVYEGRPSVELVTRMIATVGNYDYLLDWIFTQDGKIRVRVGATGIDSVKGVHSASMDEATAEQDTAYGTLVGPHIVAVNHDHYFNFRLDLDVDGPNNSFELSQFEPTSVEDSPRSSVWRRRSTILKTEREAMLSYDAARPSSWEVINQEQHQILGHHPGYLLMPENSAISNILSPEDYPVQRAAFSLHHLWVTPYDPQEYYAGGMYVNQSKGGDGLPAWTQSNRSIDKRDIVLWYTAGLRHEPHLEDWPVMPLVWREFQLAPHNFFARNAALNLRKP